jgi:6-phosphogluconolactonase
MSQIAIHIATPLYVLGFLLSLAGCGSGLGGRNLFGPVYSVGGTVTDLAGSGLTLQINPGAGTCTIPRGVSGAQASFCFAGGQGQAYNITVRTQPSYPSQTCVVANGAGTIGSADVTNVNVTCTTNASRFAYVASGSSNSISAYSIDATSGALTPLTNAPFGAMDPRFVVVEPSGKHAMVANGNSASISVYAIDTSSGTLTTVVGSPFAAGKGPSAVIIDSPDGFVYATNQAEGTVSAYSYNASNGSLTPAHGSPFTAGQGPLSLSMTLDRSLYAQGQFLYVANNSSSNVSAYIADSPQGSLKPVTGSPFPAGNSPTSVVVDPASRFVYVTNQGDGTVSALKIDTTGTNPGALAVVPGSPFAAGSSPAQIVVDAYDRFAYVANKGDGTISAYTIDATTGALSAIAGSPFTDGNAPSSLVVDNLGRFLYVVNSGSSSVSVYAIDPSSGALTPISGSPFATEASPISIALSN